MAGDVVQHHHGCAMTTYQQPSLALRAHVARHAVELSPVEHLDVGRVIGRKDLSFELGEYRRAASDLPEHTRAHGNAAEAQAAPREGARPGRWVVHLALEDGIDSLLLHLAPAQRAWWEEGTAGTAGTAGTTGIGHGG